MSFIKGVDISIQHEIEQLGAKYYNQGKEGDAIQILKTFNINAIRLRLWCDPYDENHMPYGGGTNDLRTTILLARRAKLEKMQFLLDLHYSDFWADPETQIKPKAWQNLNGEALEDAVYNYTFETIKALNCMAVLPDMVQIGNEITNGFLWPNGKFDNIETMSKLLSAGIKAVKDFSPDIKTIIHLDRGGDNIMYRRWFDRISPWNIEFDIIGLSYYPFWHGTLEELINNMNDISSRYDKDVLVVETAFPFTTEHKSKTMIFTPELAKTIKHSIDTKGECAFMRDLMEAVRSVKNNRGIGFFYWEPTWINIEKACWATEAGKKYLNNSSTSANAWANLALFDFNGNALPALKTIRDF